MIPLDTAGQPLPPPCQPEKVCKLEPGHWPEYWEALSAGRLPVPVSCCVCGWWFQAGEPGDRKLLHRDALARLNTTLSDITFCRGCRAKCPTCELNVSRYQLERFAACQMCAPAGR